MLDAHSEPFTCESFSSERFRVRAARLERGGAFVARVRIEVDAGPYQLNGSVLISTRDAEIGPGQLGASALSFQLNVLMPRPVLYVPDFVVPAAIRSSGVARWVWRELIGMLPAELRQRTILKGRLVQRDSTPDNAERRDRLWREVSGGLAGHPDAVYVPQLGDRDGLISGPLHAPAVPADLLAR
jgi:hypothetical protein